MEIKKVVLPSGAEFLVNEARFDDSDALTKALLKCAKGLPITKELFNMDVTMLRDPLIEAATSSEVSGFLFKCLNVCMYENMRVSKDLFDDPKVGSRIRRDYYPMAWEVIRVNCGPFFEQLTSWFKTLRPTVASSQKSA